MSGGPLRVLALTSLYPSPWKPDLAAFNRQQLEALAGLCRLGLVAPIPFMQALAWPPRRRQALSQPFPTRRPWFWYLPGVKRAWLGRCFLDSAWPSLRALARQLAPQALLATWLYPDAWAGLLAARRLGLPLVVKLHGSDVLRQGLDPARRPYMRQVLAAAQAVVAVSPSLAQAAQELGAPASRLRLVPNGVDTALFHPADKALARRQLGLPAQGPLFLYLGWLVEVKGPAVALQALARLENARLVLVGDGPLKPALLALASRLGLEQRLVWAGAQPHARVAGYLAACDALVLPSLSEGEPNAVLEALASGRPVAASAVGGVPGLVHPGRQGYLAPAGDAKALAQAMAQVLAQTWSPQELAAPLAGRDWRTSAQALHAVLARAVEEGAQP